MGGGYTYLLRCADGTLYTGWTNDLQKRLRAHNAGTASKYTRSRRPVELVWWEEFATREEAMRREWQVKQLSRGEKLALIAEREQGGGPAAWKSRTNSKRGDQP